MSRRKKRLDFADVIDAEGKVLGEFPLALDAAADTHVGYAIKGGGKTWLGMKLSESILDAGGQVIAIDITGVWWGLTSSTDGKGEGFPLYIFGGNKADLPLEPESGELVARTLIESRASAVLDMSLMRKGKQRRFAADFLEALYDIKAEGSHRDYVLTLMLDEGNRFAPQKADTDQTRVLGAAEDIILQGRSRGLGLVTLTQRPAVLNKNISTQAGGLILGRISSPQDQKAVAEWLEIHASPEAAKRILGKPLANLPRGEFIYISTSGGEPVRIRLRPRVTFDSSFTPKPGQRRIVAKVRAKLDVGKLSAEIQAVAKAAEENKPSALRARVDWLIAENERLKQITVAPTPERVKVRRVDTPALGKRDLKLIERIAEGLGGRTEAIAKLADVIGNFQLALATDQSSTARAVETITAASFRMQTPLDNFREVAQAQRQPPPLAHIHKLITPGPNAGKPGHDEYGNRKYDASRDENGGDAAPLRRIHRKFLTALAATKSGQLKRRAILTHARYAPGSGPVSKAFSFILANGYAEAVDGTDELLITGKGRHALGPVEHLPTGRALRELLTREPEPGIKAKLPSIERKFLAVLINHYPAAMSKAQVIAEAGYQPGSGPVSRAFSWLQKRGYATSPTKGNMRASDELFDAGER